MRHSGIGVNVHYRPLHLLTAFRHRFRYKRGDYPVAESAYDEILSLPIYPGMSDGDVRRVIRTLFDILGIHHS